MTEIDCSASRLHTSLVSPSALQAFAASHPELPDFDSGLLSSHAADAHWIVSDESSIRGRCSLWWKRVPSVNGQRFGLIGHYACVDHESAEQLLNDACDHLTEQGCDQVIGPMDQNTWRDYRFIIEDQGRDVFFLEPRFPSNGRAQFIANGFREIATYSSLLVEDLGQRTPSVDRARTRLNALGISIRPIRSDALDNELSKIHSVVRTAFRDNPFYLPVERDDFINMYAPLRTLLREEFVLVAEHNGNTVGFCFAIPDYLQQRRGEDVDTIIVKTFATLPDRCYSGLGQVMLEQVHQKAQQNGLRYAILALVREVPHLQRIMGRYGKTFRRYALFGKGLSS